MFTANGFTCWRDNNAFFNIAQGLFFLTFLTDKRLLVLKILLSMIKMLN